MVTIYCYWCLKLAQGNRLADTIRDGTAVCNKHIDGATSERENY